MDGKLLKLLDLFVCFPTETTASFGRVHMELNTNSFGWEMLPCAGHAAGGSSREKRVQEHAQTTPEPSSSCTPNKASLHSETVSKSKLLC